MKTIATLLLLAGTAEARLDHAGFFLDGATGVGVPIGDSRYTDASLIFWKFGLRGGAALWFTPRLGIAPELAADGGPEWGTHSTGVTLGKFRAQTGLRFLVGFGKRHAFFLRATAGAEGLIFGPGGRLGAGQMNWGFVVEPGAGVELRIARRAVVGLLIGFPVGLHTFGQPITEVFADFDATVFFGYRM